MEVINSFASSLLKVNTGDEAAWAVAKHAVARLGYEDCVVYLVNDEGVLYQSAAHGAKNPIAQDIESPITLRIGEGICGSVAASGKGEIIPDTSKDPRYQVDDSVRLSEITIPIIINGDVVGIIDSEHPEKDYFKEQDFNILTTIASMVSTKIDQAKTHQEIAKHKDQLELRVEESTKELKATIAKLMASNEVILQSIVEKETLLKEIHHRVKNNLQIISSLLNLHANRSINSSQAEVFIDCQNRIKSMAVIHEQLYNKDNLAQIDSKIYIEEICAELFDSFNISSRIKLIQNVAPITLSIDISIPFGLILNELLVNALKHAFPFQEGILKVSLKLEGNAVTLVIEDNGPGFNLEKEFDTMGLELIETLTEQLDGEIDMQSNSSGTSCKISFQKK